MQASLPLLLPPLPVWSSIPILRQFQIIQDQHPPLLPIAANDGLPNVNMSSSSRTATMIRSAVIQCYDSIATSIRWHVDRKYCFCRLLYEGCDEIVESHILPLLRGPAGANQDLHRSS